MHTPWPRYRRAILPPARDAQTMLVEFLRHGRGTTGEPFRVGATGIVGVTNLFVGLYAARAGDQVILFDTGLDPRGRPVDRLLRALDAVRDDVRHVFLTHCHPDHVAAAPLLGNARIHAGAADAARMAGEAPPCRAAERWFRRLFSTPPVRPTDLHVDKGEVALVPGDERVLVVPLPGDTPGACAFLFRNALFVGDSLDLRGDRLRPAWGFATDDAEANLRSIASLPDRLADRDFEYVCTAHGGPTKYGEGRSMLTQAAELARNELLALEAVATRTR